MNIVKVICKETEIQGVIIGENKIGIKMITNDRKSVLIPKDIIKKVESVRDLNIKEEIEASTIIKNRQRIVEKTNEIKRLQNELEALKKFNKEQEVYVASLICDKNNIEKNNEDDKLNFDFNSMDFNLPNDCMNALKVLIENNIINIKNS
ncbi:MAG: hypothetical protein K0R54_645 [Clostridiaceae bacterium]|jgi:hypothetical protein|nr:hypothetical protein [Clostridiaceae bacterium]